MNYARPQTIEDYYKLAGVISSQPLRKTYDIVRYLLRTDLFFFMWYGCERTDMEHPWLIARCREVESNPNGFLDLWSRDHYKSSIITFGKTMQDIIASHGDDPLPVWEGLEPSIGLFSHTRPIAKGFLKQIKRESEYNVKLHYYYPDVFWENPNRDSPSWSTDGGLIFKKKTNPKEATIEAWGLIEGQPTSKHFDILIFDDMVTLRSARSSDDRKKTLEAWEMAINLGGGEEAKVRMIGTRYHFNDAYREIIKRKAAIPRIYPGTIDGTFEGEPVLKSKKWMVKRLRDIGRYTFSTQILQNPIADSKQTLNESWLQYYTGNASKGTNKYLICDPASEKKTSSDYTVMMVIGLGSDKKYRILDIVRDRFNLKERGDALFNLHRKWEPLGVGYEKYGMQADIEYYYERMKTENYRFEITQLGGNIPKPDRIKGLVPSLEQGRWLLPETLFYVNYEGRTENLIETYKNEEYMAFPVSVHDDMLDCQARILDKELNAIWPKAKKHDERDRYSSGRSRGRTTSAWGA